MLSREEEWLCGVGGALVDPSPCIQVAPSGDPQKPQCYVIPNAQGQSQTLRRAQPPVGSATGRTPSARGEATAGAACSPRREAGDRKHGQEQAWPVESHAAPAPKEPTAWHGCSLRATPGPPTDPGLETSPVCAPQPHFPNLPWPCPGS